MPSRPDKWALTISIFYKYKPDFGFVDFPANKLWILDNLHLEGICLTFAPPPGFASHLGHRNS